jgi:AcrR family transcriptional regulator
MDSRKIERVFGAERTAIPRRRAPTTRSRADDRLNAILAAATHTIAHAGYERASMRSIAREARLSLAGLYHHVTGKEQLLFMIQFRAFSALLTEIQSHLCGVEDPIEQLRVVIRTHVLYVAENMDSLKVCSHELDSLSGEAFDQVRRVRREYYELVRAIIGRVIHDRAPHSGLDRRAATMCLFGSLNWLYRWYDPAGERSPTNLANQIFTQFLAGILGAPHPAGTPRRSAAGDGLTLAAAARR